MSGMGFMDAFSAVRIAASVAVLDILTIAEFTGINYAVSALGPAIANAAPAGLPRFLLLSSVDAAADITKLILWQGNMIAAKAAPSSAT